MQVEFKDKFKDAYIKGQLTAPSDVAPEGEKEVAAWLLQWAKYTISSHCAGFMRGGADGTIRGESIGMLRAYGRGEQPEDQYRLQLDKVLKGEDKKSWTLMNISFKNVMIYPAFRERMIDRLMKVNFEPGVIAMSTAAQRQKELNYFRDKLAADQQTQAVFQGMGMTPENITPAANSMDQADIDTLNGLGGYSLAVEIELKAAIVASFDFSRYEPSLKRQFIEDLVDLNFVTLDINHDPATMQQTIHYVDPNCFIGRTGAHDDCRDMDMGGYLSYKTISQLRPHFDEATLFEIARSYRTICGNSAYAYSFDSAPYVGDREMFSQRYNSSFPYDQFRVQVYTGYVIALDVERYVTGVRPEGPMIFDKVPREAKLNKHNIEKGKSMTDTKIQYVYRVNWVVGTEHVYNIGKDAITVRDGAPGDMRAMLPMVVWCGNRPSITQSVVSVVDDLQIAVLQSRNARAKMPPPPNIAINVAAIEDSMQLGTALVTPADILEIYAISGILAYAGVQQGVGEGSVASPIIPLPNTTLEYMTAIQAQIEASINMLRLVTGSNELSDGQANPTDVLNGVQKSYEEASNRALNLLYVAHQTLYQNTAMQIAKRYQVVAAKGGGKLQYIPTGSPLVRTINLLPEFALHDVQVVIQPIIDSAGRQAILADLAMNKQNAMINESDYFVVSNMINRGQIQEAQFYLARATERKRMQDEQSRNESMRVQGEEQAKAAVASEQAKANGEVMVQEAKGQLLTLEYKLKDENAEKEFQRQVQLLTHQAGLGMIEQKVLQTTE